MGLIVQNYNEGQTPLDPDETDGLLIPTVMTRSELDEVEQRNIEEAIRWTLTRRRRFLVKEILSEQFIMDLHKRMYGGVWNWAGQFRKTNKNIGVDKHQIAVELKELLDDCSYWITNKTYPDDEIAIRLKHRIVLIHCFANGNGRHSRLIADIIIEKVFNKPVYTWGSNSAHAGATIRSAYLAALREADNGRIDALLAFARS
jgi:Fic-DOC domain mobile mystery protein B